VKRICDLCEKEKHDAVKDDGIWVCNNKYPNGEIK